jgi:DNA-binding transcriptional LysR family regulator
MNLAALETFLAIVDNGSLIRASERLNVTQSTVTARLKTLEDELGRTLLNRSKSGVSLTPAGAKLLRYARIMSGLWRQARREAALPAGLEAVCTFGCHPDLWPALGCRVLWALDRNHPEMALSVQQASESVLETWLSEGLVDMVLTYQALSRSGSTAFELPPDDLVLYSTRPGSPIDADPFYVFVDHGEDYRKRHGESYFHAGVARVAFDSPVLGLDYLLSHEGSAYLPRTLADPHVRAGVLHELTAAPVYTRKRHLVVNDRAAANWPWLAGLIETLRQPEQVMPT